MTDLSGLFSARKIGRRVLRHTTEGQPFYVWTWDVRVDDTIRNCVAYFYHSKEEAEAGAPGGATGFFFFVPSPMSPTEVGGSQRPSHTHVYIATNRHVVANSGRATFVRANRAGGLPPAIRPLTRQDWFNHPDGDDLAVCYLGCDPSIATDSHYLSNERFVTKQQLDEAYIGLGDDCLMVGRFTPHPGVKRNLPVVRFGNISMLPEEKVELEPGGHLQEAFLVEMRSRAGFSGSPVFLVPQLGWTHGPGVPVMTYQGSPRDQTLGVVCGHFKAPQQITAHATGSDIELEAEIDDHSGMAIVIPAWRIQEILDLPEVAAARTSAETETRKNQRGGSVSLD